MVWLDYSVFVYLGCCVFTFLLRFFFLFIALIFPYRMFCLHVRFSYFLFHLCVYLLSSVFIFFFHELIFLYPSERFKGRTFIFFPLTLFLYIPSTIFIYQNFKPLSVSVIFIYSIPSVSSAAQLRQIWTWKHSWQFPYYAYFSFGILGQFRFFHPSPESAWLPLGLFGRHSLVLCVFVAVIEGDGSFFCTSWWR